MKHKKTYFLQDDYFLYINGTDILNNDNIFQMHGIIINKKEKIILPNAFIHRFFSDEKLGDKPINIQQYYEIGNIFKKNGYYYNKKLNMLNKIDNSQE